MKKRFIIVLMSLSVPVFLFFNVRQAFRYTQYRDELNRYLVEQELLSDKNDRLISGISALRSPGRIETIAEEELGLVRKTGRDLIKIEFGSESESE